MLMEPIPKQRRGDENIAFFGFIETVEDALLVIEATERGICQRIHKRLHANEQGAIRSGSVFVYDESEANMKRWTDKLFWSPSRQVGNFFVYRQMTSRLRRGTSMRSMSLEGDLDPCGWQMSSSSAAAEKPYVGSLTTSSQYARSGLVKKTLAVGNLHVISYFTLDEVQQNRLITPSQSPHLAECSISHRLWEAFTASNDGAGRPVSSSSSTSGGLGPEGVDQTPRAAMQRGFTASGSSYARSLSSSPFAAEGRLRHPVDSAFPSVSMSLPSNSNPLSVPLASLPASTQSLGQSLVSPDPVIPPSMPPSTNALSTPSSLRRLSYVPVPDHLPFISQPSDDHFRPSGMVSSAERRGSLNTDPTISYYSAGPQPQIPLSTGDPTFHYSMPYHHFPIPRVTSQLSSMHVNGDLQQANTLQYYPPYSSVDQPPPAWDVQAPYSRYPEVAYPSSSSNLSNSTPLVSHAASQYVPQPTRQPSYVLQSPYQQPLLVNPKPMFPANFGRWPPLGSGNMLERTPSHEGTGPSQ